MPPELTEEAETGRSSRLPSLTGTGLEFPSVCVGRDGVDIPDGAGALDTSYGNQFRPGPSQEKRQECLCRAFYLGLRPPLLQPPLILLVFLKKLM